MFNDLHNDRRDEPKITRPVIGAAIAVAIAALLGWFYWYSHRAPRVPVSVQPTIPAPQEDRIQHPVPDAEAAALGPIPELNSSDAAIRDALGKAGGGTSFMRYWVPENIIRHLVVTVDNLSRQKVAVDKRPLAPAAGTFIANGDELHATLDTRNFDRYQPIVDEIRKVDMQQLASVYLHFYPLFQKAYQDLGYPNGYFNDRLVSVIDGLLAAPQVAGPIELVRPNVMYQFADPALESRTAGQKLLIRMGPDNAAAVKAKLAELRAIITAAPLKH